jgi:hypothetical protein
MNNSSRLLLFFLDEAKDSNDNPTTEPSTSMGYPQTSQRTLSQSSYEPQDTYEIPAVLRPPGTIATADTGGATGGNGPPACGGVAMAAALPSIFSAANGGSALTTNGGGTVKSNGGETLDIGEEVSATSSGEPSYLTVLLPTTVDMDNVSVEVDVSEALTEGEKRREAKKGGKKERRGRGWLRWRCSAATAAGGSDGGGEAEGGRSSQSSTQEEDYIIPKPNNSGGLPFLKFLSLEVCENKILFSFFRF